jgi:magnesium-transporting ATPase (P-type)
VLAKQGFRVLALAYRVCSEPVSTLMAASQTDLESSAPITFLGLVYFSNKLKPDTFPATIQGLQSANIHVNMITGNFYFGLFVLK